MSITKLHPSVILTVPPWRYTTGADFSCGCLRVKNSGLQDNWTWITAQLHDWGTGWLWTSSLTFLRLSFLNGNNTCHHRIALQIKCNYVGKAFSTVFDSTDVSYVLLFLSLCCVPEVVLGAGDAAMNETMNKAMNKTGSLGHPTPLPPAVQWSRLCIFIAGAQGWALVRELRCHSGQPKYIYIYKPMESLPLTTPRDLIPWFNSHCHTWSSETWVFRHQIQPRLYTWPSSLLALPCWEK